MKLILDKKERKIDDLSKINYRLNEENDVLTEMLTNYDPEQMEKLISEFKKSIKEANDAKEKYEKMTRDFELFRAQFVRDLKSVHN